MMKRNKFSLSHYRLMSMKMGFVVPCGVVEVLPGDTFQHATSLFVRVSPLVAPIMHPVHIRVHHWFVPSRLVWDNFESFITGGADGLDASVFPTIDLTGASGAGTLSDYMGMPPGLNTTTIKPNALPFRAYQLIWKEWYRDQDLQTAPGISTASGVDISTTRTLQPVGWEKDYFTTSRPWTQKGPVVSIPLTGDAPIRGIGVNTGSTSTGAKTVNENGANAVNYPEANWTNEANVIAVRRASNATGAQPLIYADLSNVTAADINDLRTAFALQRYEEARARYGSRYVEYLRYLGVRSSDARLQRPEYLGGGKQTLQFSEVLQTGVTTSGSTTGVGNLKGHGIGAVRSNRYRRFFEEHGYVISVISCQPRTVYSQSIHRMWNRTVKEDFFQRELQHIGQQEILNKEVYGLHSAPTGIFGYQDRYDEYRRMESGVAGQFRSTLNYWHMAREFSSDPVLNASFVASNPTTRVFADTTNDQLYVMASHSIQARRMVARSGYSRIE